MENHTSKIGGRPPKKRIEKYPRIVSTKLTELQYYAIRKRTLQAGVPLSNYIRQAVIRGKIVTRMSQQFRLVFSQHIGNATPKPASLGYFSNHRKAGL